METSFSTRFDTVGEVRRTDVQAVGDADGRNDVVEVKVDQVVYVVGGHGEHGVVGSAGRRPLVPQSHGLQLAPAWNRQRQPQPKQQQQRPHRRSGRLRLVSDVSTSHRRRLRLVRAYRSIRFDCGSGINEDAPNTTRMLLFSCFVYFQRGFSE